MFGAALIVVFSPRPPPELGSLTDSPRADVVPGQRRDTCRRGLPPPPPLRAAGSAGAGPTPGCSWTCAGNSRVPGLCTTEPRKPRLQGCPEGTNSAHSEVLSCARLRTTPAHHLVRPCRANHRPPAPTPTNGSVHRARGGPPVSVTRRALRQHEEKLGPEAAAEVRSLSCGGGGDGGGVALRCDGHRLGLAGSRPGAWGPL